MSIDVEAFYKKYGPMVLRRCRQLLKDEHQALDAMQDTFVKLLRYKHSLAAQYPSSLLYRMATNVCLNIIRAESRRPATRNEEVLLAIASREDVEEKVWVHDLLEKIFQQEKVSTRAIAVMYYLDGMTLQEVADEVGLSLSGVRKRLRLLKARVKILEEVAL